MGRGIVVICGSLQRQDHTDPRGLCGEPPPCDSGIFNSSVGLRSLWEGPDAVPPVRIICLIFGLTKWPSSVCQPCGGFEVVSWLSAHAHIHWQQVEGIRRCLWCTGLVTHGGHVLHVRHRSLVKTNRVSPLLRWLRCCLSVVSWLLPHVLACGQTQRSPAWCQHDCWGPE